MRRDRTHWLRVPDEQIVRLIVSARCSRCTAKHVHKVVSGRLTAAGQCTDHVITCRASYRDTSPRFRTPRHAAVAILFLSKTRAPSSAPHRRARRRPRRRFALTLQFEGLLSLFEIRHSRNSRSSELFDIWVVDSATYIVKLHYMNPEIAWPCLKDTLANANIPPA